MKKTLNYNEFNQEFNEITKNNYSYQVTNALLDYYDEFDENIEFDPIAIDCDWTLYRDFEEIKENYSNTELNTLEDLNNYTYYINLDDEGILMINF